MREPASPTTSRYVVDSRDVIAAVSDSWNCFAVQNGAPELQRERVVGRPLWDFVSGAEVRYIYAQILDRVRASDAPVLLPFRCDSPERRRFMRLSISPILEGALQLDAVLVREEQRPTLVLLEPEASRSEQVLILCSWCKRARVDADDWLDLEAAVPRLDLLGRSPPRLSHGICSSCERKLSGDLDPGGAA